MIALGNGKWQRVFDDNRIAADERLAPDPAKLVNARIRADVRPVINRYVTGERGGICHNHAVSDSAIVRDVRLRHQQTIVADFGQTAAARCAAMNGDEFADVISFADFYSGRLARVFQILRRQPY